MGHHKDDVIETLFLNICYAGEISTMVPSQSFFNGHIKVIRPLAYVDKAVIRTLANQLSFPQFVNPCPSAQNSKRWELKNLLDQLYQTNRKIKGNIFHALHNVKLPYLLKQKTTDRDTMTIESGADDASKHRHH
jgi:tRNA 2-thiocytidine biosynthesis protein TtcA